MSLQNLTLPSLEPALFPDHWDPALFALHTWASAVPTHSAVSVPAQLIVMCSADSKGLQKPDTDPVNASSVSSVGIPWSTLQGLPQKGVSS